MLGGVKNCWGVGSMMRAEAENSRAIVVLLLVTIILLLWNFVGSSTFESNEKTAFTSNADRNIRYQGTRQFLQSTSSHKGQEPFTRADFNLRQNRVTTEQAQEPDLNNLKLALLRLYLLQNISRRR